MKYKTKDIEKRTNDRTCELAMLWMECDVPAQFWMRQPMEIPDATANELRALKIYWFKACHPELYNLCWIIFTCLCVAVTISGLILNLFNISVCVALIFLTVSIGHLILHDDMIKTVEWYEAGKPIEY